MNHWPPFLLRCLLAALLCAASVRAQGAFSQTSTRYEYDAAGNLWRVTDPLNGVTVLLYDAANQLTNRTLPNGVVTTFSYNLRGQLINLVHVKNGTVLAGAAYERQGVGEPARITREDGSYVDLGYDHAHRLTNETHRASGGALVEQISYGYDVAGNRTSHVTAAGSHAYSYLGGHRLSTVTGPASQSFSWDTGGRVSGIARDGETLTLGYNSDDRLTSVSDGTATLTYTYDAQGRRVRAASGGSERRFVVAPMANSGLESPHLVTDGANAVLGGFAYVGGQPLMRFDANGVPTYYLEDAMGSVIALADSAGVPTALFAYDGFGNLRAAAGATNGIAGVGGDYRFHGHWFEEATGLYHARARDYDARTGRFIERDPVEGDPSLPESFQPYVFADNNPHYYSDPTGLFTISEVNISAAISQSLQGARSAAINVVKDKVKQSLTDAVIKFTTGNLSAFIPLNQLKSLSGLSAGNWFENKFRGTLCELAQGAGGNFHFAVALEGGAGAANPGRPKNSGVTCEGVSKETDFGNADFGKLNKGAKKGVKNSKGTAWPDLIIGDRPPRTGSAGSYDYPRAWVTADLKLSAVTLHNDYIVGTKSNQFDAMCAYAKGYQYAPVVAFIGALKGSGNQWKTIEAQLKKKAASKHALAFVDILEDFGGRKKSN